MRKGKRIVSQKIFDDLSKQIEKINENLEKLAPSAVIREVSSFGNSSHVVLSKEFIDKKVGVLILGDKNDR